MGLYRHKVQQGGTLRVIDPGLPGGQEIRTQTETGLEHRPAGLVAPGLGQAAALQEDLARLRQGAGATAVAVVETGAARCGRVLPVDRFGHGFQAAGGT